MPLGGIKFGFVRNISNRADVQASALTSKTGQVSTPANNIADENNGVNLKFSRSLPESYKFADNKDVTETDSQYLNALKNGDAAEARAIVDEQAERNGYNTKGLYHGSARWGFTGFDLDSMDDIITTQNLFMIFIEALLYCTHIIVQFQRYCTTDLQENEILT